MAEVTSPIPEHIGPFHVLRAIASGGMAEVYAVEDPTSGERFALKLLVAVQVALQRFNREYEAMTRLNHPGIVRVYHYGLHQGQPWLSMELLRGKPAQPWVKQFGKPGTPGRTAEVLRVAYHLAQSLHYVHERGLVHRDLKSANVLVLPDGRVKLVDFGTAHLFDAVKRITQEGEFVGTYAYASPEQLSGKALDARSDLYSFGVLLFRLCTGRRPFPSNDPKELVEAHLKTPAPNPSTLCPPLPEGLCTLILQLLEKKPDARPPTAGDVAQQLEVLAGKPFAIRSPLALHDVKSAGRERELRRIQTLSAEALGATVLVVGEEGSDRRRVVDTALAQASERGCLVAMAELRRDDDLRGVLGMLKVLASSAPREHNGARSLLKLARAEPLQLVMPQARMSMRKALITTLKVLSSNQSIVIGAQGLENAQGYALELLASLRSVAVDALLPVTLVAGCSAVGLGENPDLLWRFPDAVSIDLPALEPREIALAVGSMLGRRPPPAQLSMELHEVTDGQPFYLEEAVRQLVEAGGLEADDGNRLEWAGARVEIPLPPSADAHARELLARLPALHLRVLEAAALLDEEVRLDLLGEALGWTVPEVSWIVASLVHTHVLRWNTEGSTVSWRRARLRSLVADRISSERRGVHERTLAAAIAPNAPTAAQVRLLLAVGRSEEAFERCTTAARTAFEENRYRHSLSMLHPLIEQAHRLAPGAVAEAHLLFARCMHVLRPMDSSAARSLSIARKGTDGSVSRVAELDLAAALLASGIGHYQIHEKHLKTAWVAGMASGRADLTAPIALEIAASKRLRGRSKESAEWVEKARKAAIGAARPALMGHATVALARVSLAKGLVADAEVQAGNAMQFFERGGDRLGYFVSVAAWAECLRRQGRFSEALALLTQRLPEARQSEDPSVYVRMLLVSAWCEVDLCRLGRAQEMVDELAAILRRGELLALRLESRLVYGRILLASGQFLNAAFVLKDVHERARKAQLAVLAETSRALWAETHWHLRDRTRSRELFQSALLGLKGMGDKIALADACAAKARVWCRDVDPEEIFKPVAELLDNQPLPTLVLERVLCSGPWHRAQGNRPGMLAAYRESARALNRLSTHLNDTDRAALRVHPWSRRIRRGLR